jgi:hypothetical protein
LNIKFSRGVIMVMVLAVAVISLVQRLAIQGSFVTLGESQSVMAVDTYTYYRVTSTEGIEYEIPLDWKTSERDGNTYHYSNGSDYLMVSGVTTEVSQTDDIDTDMALTDGCVSTLLETLQTREDFTLHTDCSGDVDGAYCRRLEYSYSDDLDQTVTEYATIFAVAGTVYSFDYVPLGNVDPHGEVFRRIVGSIVIL